MDSGHSEGTQLRCFVLGVDGGDFLRARVKQRQCGVLHFSPYVNCVRDHVSERTGPVRNGRHVLTCCVISLDVQGKTVFLPGLLAKAHRGILYVDDINLLDTELCQILLGIVTDGWVNVEVSLNFHCRAHAMVPTVRCTAAVVQSFVISSVERATCEVHYFYYLV